MKTTNEKARTIFDTFPREMQIRETQKELKRLNQDIKDYKKAKTIIRTEIAYFEIRDAKGWNASLIIHSGRYQFIGGTPPANGVYIPDYILSNGKQNCYYYLKNQIEYTKNAIGSIEEMLHNLIQLED